MSRRAETRSRLLDAGADLFARKGFHATSAEAVADAAGRTTGALYNHFGGKEGLLVALLEDWMAGTVAQLSETIAGKDELDSVLNELWWGMEDQDDSHEGAWLLLEFELWLHAARDPVLAEAGNARIEEMRRA